MRSVIFSRRNVCASCIYYQETQSIVSSSDLQIINDLSIIIIHYHSHN